jgi:hypothetical protein
MIEATVTKGVGMQNIWSIIEAQAITGEEA